MDPSLFRQSERSLWHNPRIQKHKNQYTKKIAAMEDHNPNIRVLLRAAHDGDFERVRELVEDHGVDAGAIDQGGSGLTALANASMQGHIQIVQFLVRKGVDIDPYFIAGGTPLDWACREGHFSVVEFLVDNGADANAGEGISRPLSNACIHGQVAIALYLLEKGASWDEETFQKTVKEGHLAVVQLLLARGARAYLNARNRDGFTPLHLACIEGHHLVAQWLVQHGANVYDRTTNTNETPAELANRVLNTIRTRRWNQNQLPGLTAVSEYFESGLAKVHQCHSLVLWLQGKNSWKPIVSVENDLDGRRARNVDKRNIAAITRYINAAWNARNHVSYYQSHGGFPTVCWSWSDGIKTYVTVRVELLQSTRARDILARTTDARNVEISIDSTNPERIGRLLDEDNNEEVQQESEGEHNDQVRLTVPLPFDCKDYFINPFKVALTAGVDVGVFPGPAPYTKLLHVSLEKKEDEVNKRRNHRANFHR